YVFLGGKCRYCKARISVQYPVVEVATGLIFLLVFAKFGISNLVNVAFLFYISVVLVVIFVYDLKHYIIPDKVLFPAIIISFIYDFANWRSLPDFLLAAVVGSGFFLVLFLASKGKAMGFGDVKLAILMGLVLGF